MRKLTLFFAAAMALQPGLAGQDMATEPKFKNDRQLREAFGDPKWENLVLWWGRFDESHVDLGVHDDWYKLQPFQRERFVKLCADRWIVVRGKDDTWIRLYDRATRKKLAEWSPFSGINVYSPK